MKIQKIFLACLLAMSVLAGTFVGCSKGDSIEPDDPGLVEPSQELTVEDWRNRGIYYDFDLSKSVTNFNTKDFGEIVEIWNLEKEECFKSGFTQDGEYLRINKVVLTKLLGDLSYSESLEVGFKTKENVLYKVNVSICTRVISRVNDFLQICTEKSVLDGLYILTEDLDFDGVSAVQLIKNQNERPINRFNGAEELVSSIGFKGIFDGRGHVISNMTVNNGYNYLGGVFGQICKGAVVRNVAFVNVTSNSYSFLVGESSGLYGTIENVAVVATENCPKSNFRFLWRIENGSVLKNVVATGFSDSSFLYTGGEIVNYYGVIANENDRHNGYGYSRFDDGVSLLAELAQHNSYANNKYIGYNANLNALMFNGKVILGAEE